MCKKNFLQDEARNMELLNRIKYFVNNYDLIAHEMPCFFSKRKISDPIIEGHRICRFCAQEDTNVSFKDNAHAISEMLGNKSVILDNECDDCNHFFGEIIEDSLAKYLGITRTLSQIKGKNGYPSFKSNDGKSRIDIISEQEGIIQTTVDNDAIDLQENYIEFSSIRDAYIPIDVYRALVRISLSIIPWQEYIHFVHAGAWIRADRRTEVGKQILDEWKSVSSSYASKVIETFIPGRKPLLLQIWVFRRKKDAVDKVPYCQTVVEFDNTRFQFAVPCIEDEYYGKNDKVSIQFFVGIEDCIFNYEKFVMQYGYPQTRVINLSNHDVVKGEKTISRMSFSKKIELDVKDVEAFLKANNIKGIQPK